MPSKKEKAKVSQADLRKMMKAMKNKKGEESTNGNTAVKNQNSTVVPSLKRPLIAGTNLKYNLEPKRVKIDSVTSSTAKAATIKSAFLQPSQNNTSMLKNKNEISKKRSYVNAEETANKITKPVPAKLQKVKPAKNLTPATPLVSGFYSDSESSDEETTQAIPAAPDNKASAAGTSKIVAINKSNAQGSLPAGFFDDPETDAKMRGVETPADKMDREWESFQREVQHETGQSEQIIDEDQETGHLDREIDEIDSQIQYYHLVDKLCDKKDNTLHKIKQVVPKKENQSKDDDSASTSDEEDYLLDWREKDAFS